MRPLSLRRREGIQLSFDIPQKIYTTCVYPRQSGNGSSVIICGHESGITVIWYAGKQFKPSTNGAIVNGHSVDLTEDDDNEMSDVPQYEDEDVEVDPSKPFRDVLTHLEVPFGTGASHIAVPPLPTERTVAGFPSICESHIVIAAACTDQTLRVVAIPLQPVQMQTDIQIIRLATASMHQDLISDVAITLTAESAEGNDREDKMRSRSRSRAADYGQDYATSDKKWSLLVASTSPTGNGLLLAHQLPLEDQVISTEIEDHMPIYRRFIRSSLINARLEFNPSPSPAERHSHLLIAIPDQPSVQVYDMLPQNDQSKRRQGSVTTIDSSSSANRPLRQVSSATARPLITLLPAFALQTDDNTARRKRVLDAKWVLQGRAIATLLEDGEWGIWDLEAVGPAPSSRSNNLVKGQNNVSGIQGGALTKFALRGNVGGSVQPAKRKSGSQNRSSTESALTPMTPHTRKERASGFFKSQSQDDPEFSAANKSQGSISVSRFETAAGARSRGSEESVILTYASTNTFIPSLQAFWRSEASGKGSFGNLGVGRPQILPALFAITEEPIVSHLLPATAGSSTISFLTATASKLMLFVPSLAELNPTGQVTTNLSMRLTASKAKTQDQALLDSGELDVDGMDRILDKMANSSTEHSMLLNGANKRSLDFTSDNHDDDVDIEMGTPTLGKSSKSKLVVDRKGSEARRLFT